MGARLEDYERVAPYNSFIHVEQFKGPKELAEYLLELDKDDKKYNQYFQVVFVISWYILTSSLVVERNWRIYQHKVLL